MAAFHGDHAHAQANEFAVTAGDRACELYSEEGSARAVLESGKTYSTAAPAVVCDTYDGAAATLRQLLG